MARAGSWGECNPRGRRRRFGLLLRQDCADRGGGEAAEEAEHHDPDPPDAATDCPHRSRPESRGSMPPRPAHAQMVPASHAGSQANGG